jgi:hypothetical protein
MSITLPYPYVTDAGECDANFQFLAYNIPSPVGLVTITLSGDATGTGMTSIPTVNVALQGRPVSATAPTLNQVLQWSGSQWQPATLGVGGTVTNLAAGAGITLTPSPITTTGSIALTVPVSVANGGTGAITAPAALISLGAAPLNSPAFTGAPTAPVPTVGDSSQQIPTTSWVKSLGFITGNQGITLTGDTTGSGTTSINNTNVALQGRPVSATAPTTNQVLAWSGTQWVPTTPADGTITLSGDVTGSGTSSIPTTLAASGVTAGTYNTVTVNAKGLVTTGSNTAYLTGNQTITLSGDSAGSGTTAISATTVGLQGRAVSATAPITNQVLAWSGTQWVPTNLTAANATIADVAPTGSQGALWWDSVSGELYIYYNDGTSSQWTAATNLPAGIGLPVGTDYDQLVYFSGAWTNQRARYIASCFVPGVMTASQYLLLHRVSKNITFPANFAAYLGHVSEARGTANATASTVINVQQATSAAPSTFTTVGTIMIAAGAMVGTFATTGGAAVNFVQGDTLALVGPTVPDTTFTNFACSLVGYET